MAFLFKRNPKTPAELIRVLNDQVAKLDGSGDNRKIQDECGRYLSQIRIILYGDDDNDPQPDQIAQLSQEVYSTDCLYLLAANLANLAFDSRKDVVILFSTLLRRQIGNRSPTVDYLLSRPQILQVLFKGPEIPEITLTTGQIIRDCIKHASINKFLLNDKIFWNYFRYCSSNSFENSTDSFNTLNDLLTVHKKVVAEWLSNSNNVDIFIRSINGLIRDGNYVTKRQSIKLLSQLILQKQNNSLMIKYVESSENLKIIMNLLSDKSRNLQFEAFHVFKVFVANPKKSRPVLDILIKNRDKLLLFLKNFSFDRRDDTVFNEEREFLIEQIDELPRINVLSNKSIQQK
ncbi:Hym1 protein [Saccharomycopsis crataegensis]|uniref:Hym1 protein n=1 Tax=Saccharomycopsis crataegensis TaxID=43959 RepID=A0AAV5QSC3_9ASCO|nr:Hym1 protein [Saccharomycopsis crataegensis]